MKPIHQQQRETTDHRRRGQLIRMRTSRLVLELLSEENRRLRDEYRRARRTNYRRTALGMAGLGALSGLGAVLFPSSRTVLLALAGIGLFAGILTYFLTPEQFVSASVGERTYAAHAATGAELVETLGLSGTTVYLPTGDTADEDAGVRLFVPQHRKYDLPDGDDATTLFVATDDERQRGVAVPPTGSGLFPEFEGMVGDTADSTPRTRRPTRRRARRGVRTGRERDAGRGPRGRTRHRRYHRQSVRCGGPIRPPRSPRSWPSDWCEGPTDRSRSKAPKSDDDRVGLPRHCAGSIDEE